MLTKLPQSTRILDTRQLSISMVMIRASLCGKCSVDAPESENEIGLLGANDGPVSTVDTCSCGPH